TSQDSSWSADNAPTTFSCTTNAKCASVNTGVCTALSGTACSNATGLSCSTNADCGMRAGGNCIASSCSSPGSGHYPQPNKCNGGNCNDTGDGKNGLCPTGPDQLYCDGRLRIDGRRLQACLANGDCLGLGTCPCLERAKGFRGAG